MPVHLGRRQILSQLLKWLVAFSLTSFSPMRRAAGRNGGVNIQKEGSMNLPEPRIDGKISLERTIKNRRTIRSFTQAALTLEQFSQLLWAAQGVNEDKGYKRTAPSAGALYPMDVYAVVGREGVNGLTTGVYHYKPMDHTVSLVVAQDLRQAVAKAGLSQMWIVGAPLSFVITAEYERSSIKYGRRGVRYAMIEAGHIGQNIFLQAEALGLAAGIVGAFDDEDMVRVMHIPRSHNPLLVMPVGYKG